MESGLNDGLRVKHEKPVTHIQARPNANTHQILDNSINLKAIFQGKAWLSITNCPNPFRYLNSPTFGCDRDCDLEN